MGGILNMTPKLSIDNAVDILTRNTISLGNGSVTHATDLSDIKNIFFGKFGIAIMIATCLSTTTHLIIRIILMCTKTEMIGIAASRIVAGMKNKMATYINPFKMERKSVCSPHLVISPRDAISSNMTATSPFQAIAIGLQHICKIFFSKPTFHNRFPFSLNDSILTPKPRRVKNEK